MNDRHSGNPGDNEPAAPGPEAVPGAAAIMAAGFEPIENLTGAFWVVEVWPDEHVRSIPETRPEWTGLQPGDRVWFIRSPWDGLTAEEALAVVWATLRRDTEPANVDESAWPALAANVLTWPADSARRALED